MRIPVLFLTGHVDVSLAVEAMRWGAIDLIEKPFREQVLLDGVRRALTVDTRIRREQAQLTFARDRLSALSERERQVLDQVVEGKRSKEIARALGISLKTTNAHRAHILAKTQAESVAELVRMVILARRDSREGISSVSGDLPDRRRFRRGAGHRPTSYAAEGCP